MVRRNQCSQIARPSWPGVAAFTDVKMSRAHTIPTQDGSAIYSSAWRNDNSPTGAHSSPAHRAASGGHSRSNWPAAASIWCSWLAATIAWRKLPQQIAQLGRRAVCVAGDVTDPAARQRALDAARDELGGLDILINNAGVAAHGRFADADPGRLRPIMEVNFFAPVEFIREALPLLRDGRQPIVVNIGSILGHRGCPHKSEYSASKFALHGFSEAVRPELARLGIDVLVVAPGPTESEHFDTLLEDKGELPWGESAADAGRRGCSRNRPGDRTRPARSHHRVGRLVLGAAQSVGAAAGGPDYVAVRLSV